MGPCARAGCSVPTSALRPDPAICRRPVHAAAGRLQIAGDAPRRQRRLGDHRRHGRAARRLDRAGAHQHHRRAAAPSRRRAAASPDPRAPQPAARRRATQEVADLERLHYAVGQSIVLHKYLGAYLPTKRGKGLEWTLGEDAVRLGQQDRLRLCLVPPCRGQCRLDRAGRAAGARHRRLLRRLLRAQYRRRRRSSLMPRLVDLQHRRGRVVQRRPGRKRRCPGSSSATCARRRARRRWSTGCSAG